MGYGRETVSGGIARAITPSDTTVIQDCKALWSNAGGSVNLQYFDRKGAAEAAITITLPAGYHFPVGVPVRVRTGGTAVVIGIFEPHF